MSAPTAAPLAAPTAAPARVPGSAARGQSAYACAAKPANSSAAERAILRRVTTGKGKGGRCDKRKTRKRFHQSSSCCSPQIEES